MNKIDALSKEALESRGWQFAAVESPSDWVTKEELDEVLAGYLRLHSDNTQVVDSEVALALNRKILFERLNGAHEVFGFAGMYGSGLSTARQGDIFETEIVVLNRHKPVDISVLTGGIYLVNPTNQFNATINVFAGREILLNINNGTINVVLYDGENWLVDNYDLSGFVVQNSQLTSDVSGGTLWSWDDIKFNVYEQEEGFSMADPTCINHGAVASNGINVGIYPIVNVKDANGTTLERHMAFNEDLQDVNLAVADALNMSRDAATIARTANTTANQNKTDISQLRQDLVVNVNSLTDQIDVVDAKANESASEIADTNARLIALTSRVSTLETNAAELASRIETLENANTRVYGDLSTNLSSIRLTLGVFSILVQRTDTNTLEIRATSSSDTTLNLTHSYRGDNTIETKREFFTVGPTGTVIGTVNVGQYVMAEFWTRSINGYDIVVGSDDNSLANAWVEIKVSKIVTQTTETEPIKL